MDGVLSAAILVVVLSAVAYLLFPVRSRLRRSLAKSITQGAGRSTHAAARVPSHATVGPGEGLSDAAMMLELVAAMLDAGAGLGRSLELVAECAAPPVRSALRPVVAALAIGADWETAWRSSASLTAEAMALKAALGFAALTGAPTASILYAQAARIRRERFRAAEQRAAALGVKLVVRLGLCSLPAFICLGILPVLLAMLPRG